MSINVLNQLPKEYQEFLAKINEIIQNPVAAPSQLSVPIISTGDTWMYIRNGKVTPKDIYVFSPSAFTLLEDDGITPLDDGGGGNIVVDEVWDANSEAVNGVGSGPTSWSLTFGSTAEDAPGAIVLVDENGDVAAVYNGTDFTAKNGYTISQQPDVVSGGGAVSSFGAVTPLQFSSDPASLDADYVGSGDTKIDGDSGNKFNTSPIFLLLDNPIAGSTTGTSVVVHGTQTTFGELPVDYLLTFIRSVSAADATVQDVIADMKGVASANWDQLSGAVPFTPLDQVKVELDEVRDAYDDEHNLPGGGHLTINQLFNGVIQNLGSKVDGGGSAVLARIWTSATASVTGYRLGWNAAVDSGPAVAATAPDFVASGSMPRISTDAGGKGSAGYMEVYLNTDEDDNDGDFSIRFYVFTPDAPGASGAGYMKVLELKSSPVTAYPQVLIQTTRELLTDAFNDPGATETDKQIAVSAHNLSRYADTHYARKTSRPDYIPPPSDPTFPETELLKTRFRFGNSDASKRETTVFIELDYGSIYLANGFLKMSANTVFSEVLEGGEAAYDAILGGITARPFFVEFGVGATYGIDTAVGVAIAKTPANVLQNARFVLTGPSIPGDPTTYFISGASIYESGELHRYKIWNHTTQSWEQTVRLTDTVQPFDFDAGQTPFIGRDHTAIPDAEIPGVTIGGDNSIQLSCGKLLYPGGGTRGVIPNTVRIYYDDGTNPEVLVATDDGAGSLQGENGWIVGGSNIEYTASGQDTAGYLFDNLYFSTIPEPYLSSLPDPDSPLAQELRIELIAEEDRLFFIDENVTLGTTANFSSTVWMSYSTSGATPAGALAGVYTPLPTDPPHYGATKQYVDQLGERVIPWRKADGSPYTDGDPFVITEDDYFLDLAGDNNHIRYTYPGSNGPLLDPLNFFENGDLVNKAFVEAKFLEAEIATFANELDAKNIYGYRVPRSVVPRNPAFRQDNARSFQWDENYKVVSIDIVINELYGTWRDGSGTLNTLNYQPYYAGAGAATPGDNSLFYFYNRKVGARLAQAVQPFDNEGRRTVRDAGYVAGPYSRPGDYGKYHAANQTGIRWHSLLLHEIVGCVGDPGWRNAAPNNGTPEFGRPTLRPPDDVFYLYPHRAEFYWGQPFEVSGQCTGNDTIGYAFSTTDEIVPGSIRLYTSALPPAGSPSRRDDGVGGIVDIDGTVKIGTADYSGGPSNGVSGVKFGFGNPNTEVYYVYGRANAPGVPSYLPNVENRNRRYNNLPSGYRPLSTPGILSDPGAFPDPGGTATNQSIHPSLLMRVFFMDEVMFHIELPSLDANEMVANFPSRISHRKSFMLAMAQPPLIDPTPSGSSRWMLCRIAFALKQTNQLYRPEESSLPTGTGHVSSFSLTPSPGLGATIGAQVRAAPALIDPIDYRQARTGNYTHGIYSPFPVSPDEYAAGNRFVNFSVNFDGQDILGSEHPVLLGTNAWYSGYRYSDSPTTPATQVLKEGHYLYDV